MENLNEIAWYALTVVGVALTWILWNMRNQD